MDPTPAVTSTTVIHRGNLHPAADGSAFLLVFVLGFAVLGAVAYLATRRRRS